MPIKRKLPILKPPTTHHGDTSPGAIQRTPPVEGSKQGAGSNPKPCPHCLEGPQQLPIEGARPPFSAENTVVTVNIVTLVKFEHTKKPKQYLKIIP
jgi:hypothetical protein